MKLFKIFIRVFGFALIAVATLAPTHDYNIANQSRTLFRQDLNNVLSAIVELNSSPTEPTNIFPYMLWADTTAGLLKQRNSGNTAWLTVAKLNVLQWGHLEDATGTVTSNNIFDGTITSSDLGVNSVGNSELVNDSVTLSKQAHGVADRVIGYDNGGVPVAKQVGVNDIAANAVTLPKMATATQGSVIYYGAGGAATTLPPGSAGQVLQSQGASADLVFADAGGGTQIFTTSGTWIKPSSVTSVRVICIGAGGGGGGDVAGGSNAGGGGGGEYIEGIVSVSGNITVTIGAGGAGGVGDSIGSNGNVTTFGSLISANGGLGGSTAPVGGAGGTGGSITGDRLFLVDGNSGGSDGTGGVHGNAGAQATGPLPGSGNPGPGNNAINSGDGGSGASINANGGAGKSGICIVMF